MKFVLTLNRDFKVQLPSGYEVELMDIIWQTLQTCSASSKCNHDGKVIIKIDCSTHFKLHQSCLTLQFKYFTFLFKQKYGVINTLKMVNGYPLYTVAGVSIKYFMTLLGAIHNVIYVLFEIQDRFHWWFVFRMFNYKSTLLQYHYFDILYIDYPFIVTLSWLSHSMLEGDVV